MEHLLHQLRTQVILGYSDAIGQQQQQLNYRLITQS